MAARRNLRRRSHRYSIAAVGLLLTLGACIQDDGSRWSPLPNFGLMNTDEERVLGMEVDDALQESVTILHDPVIARFIEDLGQQIVAQIEPQPFIYRFRAIEAPSLNAFAVPGGYIYFHSGTLLAAGSVDEIAGVMGHEVAHVKAHHIARLQQQTQIPSLLTTIAGLAVAVAVQEPGALITAQATNVALQLRFTREFEAEADRLGVVYTARAGYDATGIERFFDRILEGRGPDLQLPPYLYTHPDVKDRIGSIREYASDLGPISPHDPAMDARFVEMQARLAFLLTNGRAALPVVEPTRDPSLNDIRLGQAREAEKAGDLAAAIEILASSDDSMLRDPRVQFTLGEFLSSAGRPAEAVAAFDRTIDLDPSRALVYFRLGRAEQQLGRRAPAVYAFEQARLRSGEGGSIRERADWEIQKLTFGVVTEAGFADGRRDSDRETAAGDTRTRFQLGDAEWAWWGRMSARFLPYADELQVRWVDPTGQLVFEDQPDKVARVFVASRFPPNADLRTGTWSVETWLRDDRVDVSEIEVIPRGGDDGSAAR